MKRNLFAILISLVVFAVVSPAIAQEYRNFRSPKYGFSFNLPQGFEMNGIEGKFTSWSLVPGEEIEVYGSIIPMITVTTTEVPRRYSLKTYYVRKLNRIEKFMDEPDSTFEDLKTLDFPGGYGLMVKDIIKDDPQAINHWFIHFYGNGRDYFIDISGSYTYLKKNKSVFNHVVESFTIFK